MLEEYDFSFCRFDISYNDAESKDSGIDYKIAISKQNPNQDFSHGNRFYVIDKNFANLGKTHLIQIQEDKLTSSEGLTYTQELKGSLEDQ